MSVEKALDRRRWNGGAAMMSRIARTAFARLRDEQRAGLVTYITAGDPDLPRRRREILDGARLGPAPTCSRSACRFPIRWPTVR